MTREVKVWTHSGIDKLQGSLDYTDWTVLMDSTDDIDVSLDVVIFILYVIFVIVRTLLSQQNM